MAEGRWIRSGTVKIQIIVPVWDGNVPSGIPTCCASKFALTLFCLVLFLFYRYQCNALGYKLLYSWLSACSTCCCPSNPTVFAAVHRIVPNVALIMVWALESILLLHCLFGACCSVSAPSRIKQISRMSSPLPGFTSSAPSELPFPPGCWWSSDYH